MGKAARLKKERRLKGPVMKTIEGLTEQEKVDLKVPLESFDVRTGTTIKDLRQIMKICEAIEASKDGAVELEDADHQYLIQRFTNYSGWRSDPPVRGRVVVLADKLGVQ